MTAGKVATQAKLETLVETMAVQIGKVTRAFVERRLEQRMGTEREYIRALIERRLEDRLTAERKTIREIVRAELAIRHDDVAALDAETRRLQ